MDALILEGAGTNAQAYGDNQVPWFAKPFVRVKLDQELTFIDNRTALRAFHGPVLVIKSANDVQTPIGTTRKHSIVSIVHTVLLLAASGTE